MLERAHAQYETLGQARIVKNPEEWKFCGESDYQTLSPNLVARCKDGRTIKRVVSDADFSGGALGRHVEFDAKQTQSPSIKLDNFRRGQVESLCSSERCRNLAGFMVYFTGHEKVFWVKASLVRDAQDKVMFQRKGKGKFPRSLNLSWMAAHALEIPYRAGSMLVDWLPVLMKEK